MASPSPSKARAGSKRRTDSNNTLNRDNVADLAGPSTFMRIPAVQNHISRNADILQQAANTIRHKGSRQGGEHTRTSPIISQAFSQGTGLFGREVTLIDSESDFDRAESDSGNEAPSSPVKKEVLQLRAELAAARQVNQQLLVLCIHV
jgi:K+-transporting ATPase c subunit